VYELHLNGDRVGDQVLAPGWTDYDQRVQYQTYDVTDMLAEGDNALGAVLTDGWYAGYLAHLPPRQYGEDPHLLLQLDVTYADGTSERISSDASWRVSAGPILSGDLLMGEFYDARAEMPGWAAPGFDASGWEPATVADIEAPQVVAQIGPPVRPTQELAAATVTEPSPGVFVYDMGQNMVGWVRLQVAGPAATEVQLRHAEVLQPDGNIYTDNLRAAKQTDVYVLAGTGEEVYEPSSTFHGFRYVEVTGYPAPRRWKLSPVSSCTPTPR
jgi:alpha-L-rhamnosidase